jgi:hypothetical protein
MFRGTQRTLTAQGGISTTAQAPQMTITKKTAKKHKTRPQTTTLFDCWNFSQGLRPPPKMAKTKRLRKVHRWKRFPGNHDNVCDTCNEGGHLVECHTCSRVCHIHCAANMPSNVQDTHVIWRCHLCETEHGPTRPTQQTANTTPQTTSLPPPRTQAPLEPLGDDDSDTTGRITPELGIQRIFTKIGKHTVITIHTDGHCLRRAIAKLNMLHPGQVVRYIRRKCEDILLKGQRLHMEPDITWYEKYIQRAPSFENILNNRVSPTTRAHWGAANEIQCWALVAKREVHVFDQQSHVITIYKPTLTALPQGYKYATYEAARRQTINMQVLLFNGSHYNAVEFSDIQTLRTAHRDTTSTRRSNQTSCPNRSAQKRPSTSAALDDTDSDEQDTTPPAARQHHPDKQHHTMQSEDDEEMPLRTTRKPKHRCTRLIYDSDTEEGDGPAALPSNKGPDIEVTMETTTPHTLTRLRRGKRRTRAPHESESDSTDHDRPHQKLVPQGTKRCPQPEIGSHAPALGALDDNRPRKWPKKPPDKISAKTRLDTS